MLKLKPEIKARVLEALRSGTYAQGRNRLHTIDNEGKHTFCCLGVMCDLAAFDGVGNWDDPVSIPFAADDDPNGEGFRVPFIDSVADPSMGKRDTEAGVLTQGVVKWAFDVTNIPSGDVRRLNSSNPTIEGITLASRNDEGMSFDAIADVIEEHL